MSGPPIEHERTPQSHPGHHPQPAQPPSNPQPRRPRKRLLNDRADAHEEEEPSDGDIIRPIPEPPQGDVVKDGGYGESAHEGAGPPEEFSDRTRSEHDENVSPELVPADAPKLLKRCGHQRSVKDRRPCGSWLTKDDSTDQDGTMVRGINHRVRPHAVPDAAE